MNTMSTLCEQYSKLSMQEKTAFLEYALETFTPFITEGQQATILGNAMMQFKNAVLPLIQDPSLDDRDGSRGFLNISEILKQIARLASGFKSNTRESFALFAKSAEELAQSLQKVNEDVGFTPGKELVKKVATFLTNGANLLEVIERTANNISLDPKKSDDNDKIVLARGIVLALLINKVGMALGNHQAFRKDPAVSKSQSAYSTPANFFRKIMNLDKSGVFKSQVIHYIKNLKDISTADLGIATS